MLYEGKPDETRKYFEKALELRPQKIKSLLCLRAIIPKIDVITKIAQSYWRRKGKYEPSEKVV